MLLKPDQVELDPAEHKAAFSGSHISNSGRTGLGILGVERWHALTGKQAHEVIRASRLRRADHLSDVDHLLRSASTVGTGQMPGE